MLREPWLQAWRLWWHDRRRRGRVRSSAGKPRRRRSQKELRQTSQRPCYQTPRGETRRIKSLKNTHLVANRRLEPSLRIIKMLIRPHAPPRARAKPTRCTPTETPRLGPGVAGRPGAYSRPDSTALYCSDRYHHFGPAYCMLSTVDCMSSAACGGPCIGPPPPSPLPPPPVPRCHHKSYLYHFVVASAPTLILRAPFACLPPIALHLRMSAASLELRALSLEP